ncbi:MFS transporter [Dactylosporangium aurantiacum]|uniref:MFS transporter n=1 Tax=Dactylosporangium aurantiacum TaxID=35754 RepID=A0A9Q9IL34_9ACTN|nr:MFS transporter [Dactylosporangium aurantiacum]MDG6106144.1 MFS transporter [Dactylosporangium aurantiacum]UWZ55822.1 MFS transporter [Dactylosporangium aurantiacum]
MAPLPSPAAPGARAGSHRAFHGWRIVAVFAVTQTAGYGCLYYTFAVLLHPIAADLHTTATAVTGAITTALLASAAAAVPVGRWLDRHGGRALMTAGSLAGAGLLIACSQVRTVWQLYMVFTGLGIAMAMALYEPATAVIVSWFDQAHRSKAVLAMIVVAGFASTIFMPLTGLLEHRHGWRTTLLVLAGVYAAVAVPLHALVVRRAPTDPTDSTNPAGPARRRPSTTDERRVLIRAAVRDGRFWCLAVAFVAHGAAMSAMTVHLVGFLTSKGHPVTFAATVAGLLGVLSVTGRVLLTGAQRRIRLHRVVAVIFSVQAAAALTLPFVGATRPGAAVAVIGFGIGFGVASLATPALLADRYGTTAYASIAGTLAAPVTLAKAGAPLGAAALAAAGGYTPVLVTIGACSLVAAAGILTRADSPTPTPHRPPHSAEERADSDAIHHAAGADSPYLTRP